MLGTKSADRPPNAYRPLLPPTNDLPEWRRSQDAEPGAGGPVCRRSGYASPSGPSQADSQREPGTGSRPPAAPGVALPTPPLSAQPAPHTGQPLRSPPLPSLPSQTLSRSKPYAAPTGDVYRPAEPRCASRPSSEALRQQEIQQLTDSYTALLIGVQAREKVAELYGAPFGRSINSDEMEATLSVLEMAERTYDAKTLVLKAIQYNGLRPSSSLLVWLFDIERKVGGFAGAWGLWTQLAGSGFTMPAEVMSNLIDLATCEGSATSAWQLYEAAVDGGRTPLEVRTAVRDAMVRACHLLDDQNLVDGFLKETMEAPYMRSVHDWAEVVSNLQERSVWLSDRSEASPMRAA